MIAAASPLLKGQQRCPRARPFRNYRVGDKARTGVIAEVACIALA
jgi:hypothetical protein